MRFIFQQPPFVDRNRPLPAVPTVSFPIMFALPPIGNVGVLTTLASPADGIECSAFQTVDTTP